MRATSRDRAWGGHDPPAHPHEAVLDRFTQPSRARLRAAVRASRPRVDVSRSCARTAHQHRLHTHCLWGLRDWPSAKSGVGGDGDSYSAWSLLDPTRADTLSLNPSVRQPEAAASTTLTSPSWSETAETHRPHRATETGGGARARGSAGRTREAEARARGATSSGFAHASWTSFAPTPCCRCGHLAGARLQSAPASLAPRRLAWAAASG